MRKLVVAFVLCCSTVALADKIPVKGLFAWDYMKPKASKCAKVTPALEKKVGAYECSVPDKGTTASGKDAAASCQTKDAADGYLFFAKLADCNAERDAQLANAE